ncbi:MAG: DinB family protein [Candidatus Limnocylindria bacterium]
MSRTALSDLLGHHTWATITLIEFVRGLGPEECAWTAPGTYGAIDQTLAHLVGADTYYLFRLTGEWPSAGELEEEPSVDLEDLLERAREAADRYEAYASDPIDPDEVRESRSGRRETVGTILAQAIHHGNEHRSQVGTILDAAWTLPSGLLGLGLGSGTSRARSDLTEKEAMELALNETHAWRRRAQDRGSIET